jgi:DNA-binding protein HU-beta
MNKSQLISLLASIACIPQCKAEKVLAITLDGIANTLTNGDTVSLRGFGQFGVRKRAARTVRDSQTGKEMLIKAALIPYFKAGQHLKDVVDCIDSSILS